jgi:DHA1 family bicyclomycin/chloramphenicol resistance-like MFS transporter
VSRGFAPESLGTSAILIGAVALGPVSTDLYLPSLPSIGRDLGADVAATQLTLSVFLAAFALVQIPVGPLSDRFGRRPILLSGLAVYALASVACAFAPSIEMLIAARAVQAAGACAGVVLGRAVVRDIYGPDRAARMLAYIGGAVALAPMVGPIIGGLIQSLFGWRWNFGVLATFAVITLALGLGGLPESNTRRDPRALDPSRMVANFGTLLRHRGFLGCALAVAFIYAGLFAFISGASFVLIDGLGVPPDRFGYIFAIVVIGYITGTQIAGRLTMRLGIARMVWLGGSVSLVAGGVMAVLAPLAAGSSWALAAIAAPMACYTMGAGIVMPNGQAGALAPFAHMAGAASALMGFLQMAIAALVGIVFGQIHDGTPLPMALLVAASGCCALASFVVLARPAR